MPLEMPNRKTSKQWRQTTNRNFYNRTSRIKRPHTSTKAADATKFLQHDDPGPLTFQTQNHHALTKCRALLSYHSNQGFSSDIVLTQYKPTTCSHRHIHTHTHTHTHTDTHTYTHIHTHIQTHIQTHIHTHIHTHTHTHTHTDIMTKSSQHQCCCTT